MKGRTASRCALLATAALVLAAAGQAPAASAAPPATAPAELPAEAQQVAPVAGAGTSSTASRAPSGALASRSAPLTGVDAATEQREKEAAVASPTGAQPDLVRRPGSTLTRQSMPLVFDGLDRPGSANNGVTFSPPDTIVGTSPNRILEGTNSALRLSTIGGGPIQTLDLNTFTGAAVANGRLFDPKVYYDRSAANPRFFVVALQVSGRGDASQVNDISRIWVAVSRSPNPANLGAANWCFYNIDGIRNPGVDQSWADYPGIGVGADSFSFTMNQFRFTDDAFRFAIIRTFNKTVAENNAAACPGVPTFTWQPAAAPGDFSVFTIQPAQHYTNPSSFVNTTNPAYFLSTTRGTSTQYHVWRIRNVGGGAPTLNRVILVGAGYGIPPSSPQPGTATLVATGDNRMLQTAGIANTLVGTLTTVCNFTAATPNESCSLTPRVNVGADAAGNLTAAIAENTLAGFGDNIFIHHNSVATNGALQSGATWEYSGAGFFLSSASMIKNAGGAWVGVLTYAPGTCALPPTPPSATTSRSGDYSGAQTDPALVNFWLAGEQAVTIAGVCQWRTRVGRLVP